MKRRKGNAMVEAAVVFPLVILTIISVIYILIFMYGEVSVNARVHVAANAEMGEDTGTVKTLEHVPSGIKVYEALSGLSKSYFAEKDLKFQKGGLLTRSFTKTIETRTYSVDEKKLIRYTDLVK